MKYRAEGGAELVSAAQQKSARFHGLPDSEIYTTEYVKKSVINSISCPVEHAESQICEGVGAK